MPLAYKISLGKSDFEVHFVELKFLKKHQFYCGLYCCCFFTTSVVKMVSTVHVYVGII